MDALVGAEMVEDVAVEDGRDGLVRALRVVIVIVARAGDGVSGGKEVDLALGVLEAEEASGHDGDYVRLVVDTCEVGHLDERTMSGPSRHQPHMAYGERTLSSKSWTKSELPTRGVPYVTPLMWMSDGRLRVRKSESSSATAPPSECPIWETTDEGASAPLLGSGGRTACTSNRRRRRGGAGKCARV